MTHHLVEARRLAQEVARVHRHLRFLRKRGRLAEAEAALLCFQTARVLVVPSGCWRALADLLGEAERPAT